MSWLDNLKGKGSPAASGSPPTKTEPPEQSGGDTVVRPGITPAATVGKSGARFQPNQDVGEHLQIKTLLGSGAMGEVYLARQRLWDVDVAVKIPNDEILSDPDNRHRIIREAEAWTDLGLHPNIAYCYYAQSLGDSQYALSASSDHTLKLWEVASGSCLRTLETIIDWADGVASGRCVRVFEGHNRGVNSVCLSGDGRYALSGSDDKTLKLWEVASGRCLRTLEHDSEITSAVLSPDGQHIICGSMSGTVAAWFLDWDLEETEPADWDEGARPYLSSFLRAHQPYAGTLPKSRQPTALQVTRALTRKGRPAWSEDDFKSLLYTLGCAGYGWLRPEGVRRELKRMTREWKDI